MSRGAQADLNDKLYTTEACVDFPVEMGKVEIPQKVKMFDNNGREWKWLAYTK